MFLRFFPLAKYMAWIAELAQKKPGPSTSRHHHPLVQGCVSALSWAVGAGVHLPCAELRLALEVARFASGL